MTQGIDAAAMDLYIGYKNFSTDVTHGCRAKIPVKDFDAVVMGGIIRF